VRGGGKREKSSRVSQSAAKVGLFEPRLAGRAAVAGFGGLVGLLFFRCDLCCGACQFTDGAPDWPKWHWAQAVGEMAGLVPTGLKVVPGLKYSSLMLDDAGGACGSPLWIKETLIHAAMIEPDVATVHQDNQNKYSEDAVVVGCYK
jgi:hypothetical protein